MSEVEVWADTNTFLHFKSLDHLDWPALTGSATDITVTVCSAVMGELDDKKHRGDTAKLRERAKNSIGRLHKWRTGEIVPGVRLRLVADEPKVDWDREGLDPQVRDDRIIASVMAQGRCDRRVLMTDDLNLGLKAEGRTIAVINLPDSDRLPDLKGQQEVVVEDLRRQLAVAKDREPKLKLVFAADPEDEAQVLRVRLVPPSPLDKPGMKALIEAKKLELEHVAAAYREQKYSDVWPVEQGLAPYLKDIPRYLDEYEKWRRDEIAYNDRVSRTVKIAVKAVNVGRGSADGLHAVVYVPDGPAVYKEFPDRPKEPRGPRKPMSPFDALQQSIGLSALPQYLTQIPRYDFPGGSGIDIKRVNSFKITWIAKELMHGLAAKIDPFYCEWPSIQQAKSFTMTYDIHCRNLPEPTKGELSVIIEVV